MRFICDIKCFSELRNCNIWQRSRLPLTLVALFFAGFRLLRLTWEVIVKRSLFSLAFHLWFFEASTHMWIAMVLCFGTVTHCILLKLAVNTTDSFCTDLPVQVSSFFPSEVYKRMITKLSLRFTHTQKKSWEEKSQYDKISGTQSGRCKIVWEQADFRLLMRTLRACIHKLWSKMFLGPVQTLCNCRAVLNSLNNCN